jgi:hypothetical protein
VVAEASAMTCDWLQEAAQAAGRHALSLRWGRCRLHGRGLGISSSRGSTCSISRTTHRSTQVITLNCICQSLHARAANATSMQRAYRW